MPILGGTSSDLLSPGLRNPVTSWLAVSVPATDDLGVAVALQWRQAEIRVPGVGEHEALHTKAV